MDLKELFMNIPDWVGKVFIGFLSGIAIQISVLIAKTASKLIISAQKRQRIHSSEILRNCDDLEEILGDFLEKHRNIARKASTLSRWKFFFLMVFDILALFKGLSLIAIRRLINSNETPRA